MRTHWSPAWILVACVLVPFAANAQRAVIELRGGAAPAIVEIQENKDVALHVELSARTIPPGGPLLAGVEMRNISTHDLDIQVANNNDGFVAEVKALDGQWGRSATNELMRPATVTLLPGEEQMSVLDVARVFDLTQPGNYELRVRRSSGAYSLPVVFSVVAGALPDARKAAVPDPQLEAAAAVYAGWAANAPIQVTGPGNLAVKQHSPLKVDITLTNRSSKTVRFGYQTWVRLEVEYPDGRTVQIFDRKNHGDLNQMLQSTVPPQGSKVFQTTVQDRFDFPAPGNYTLRFWFPRAANAYSVPVTVTSDDSTL